ncbi:MAG: alpha/beta hydrolase [Candidatus Aminicenantes bacterium]|nr:alpha/beta hydrolase [Candidatus Aminicenantes bacterium]
MYPVVILAAVIYMLMCAFLFFAQSSLLYYPGRSIHMTPGTIGFRYEDVSYTTGDGVKISAWYIPAEKKEAKIVILFCHGNAGNISHRLDTIAIFRQLGLNTFLFDYRGYGRSAGKPSEKGTYLDVAGAWDYLTEEKGIAPGNIILAGRSLGGAVAAWMAVKEKPRALIVESTFTSIPDAGAKLYPFLPVRLLSRFSYDTRENIKKVKCPVLVVHSPDDELIPYAFGREIFEAANEPKRFLVLSGSHNEGFMVSRESYVSGLREFLGLN